MLILASVCFTISFFEVVTGIKNKKKRYLLMLQLSAAVLLLSDRGEYLWDGNTTQLGFWMVRITSFLLFLCVPIILHAYNRYLQYLFSESEGLSPNLKRFKIIDILLAIHAVLTLSTPFTGAFYYFDESNIYYRGPLIIVSFAIGLIVLLLFITLTLQFYKKLPKRMRLLLFLFTGNPFFSSIYQLFVMYFEAINLTIGAMAILLFIFDLLDVRAMEKHNRKLKDEVAERNEHLIKMQDNLITSLAVMVESRDNSTGGHILRTKEVVRIITDEMRKDPDCKLSDDFFNDILQATPMHDLGKIAIDDAILRKQSQFLPGEYEIMKTHAEKGYQVLHDILKDTEKASFKIVAENIAHYHHEKWDGTGYPCGLKGEEIPIEARIMAIADVYDALMSNRAYKGKMSFEETDRMIMEGMGTHFDKNLEKYYVAARPKLEEYYKTVGI